MKIKYIRTTQYGVLKDFFVQCQDLTLFYGENESGKTTLVDALREGFTSIRKIKSRGGKPKYQGEVEIGIEVGGRMLKLPSEGKQARSELKWIFDHPELVNLLIVRASDLVFIQAGKEKEWWDNFKNFFIGVNIGKIIDEVKERGGLTDKRLQAKSKLEKERNDCVQTITQISQLKLKIENLFPQKEKLRKLSQKCEGLKKEYRQLKQAEQYERFLEAKGTYDAWHRFKEKLNEYTRIRAEDSSQWIFFNNQLQKIQAQEAEKRGKIEVLENTLTRLEREYQDRKEKRAEIETQKEWLEKNRRVERLQSLSVSLRNFTLAQNFTLFAIPLFLILGVLGGVFSNKLLSGIFCFSSLGLLFLYLILRLLISQRKVSQRRLLSELKRYRSEINSLGRLEEVLQELDDKLRVELQGEQEIREKQRELRSAIAKLRPEMERLNKEKLKIENSIEEIRKKAGVRDLEELRTKVTEKDKLQFQLNSSSQKLISLLGGDSSLWLEKLQELEVAPPGVKADAVRLKKLEDEISLLENEIRRYKENIQEVEEVEIKKRGFNTLAEVYQAESEKKAKLTQIDIRLEGAREATRILASISGNFNYYLQEAFSKGEDSVSAYFKEFTAGRYQEVVLIHPTTDPTPPEGYAIKVTANNGRVYSVEELSSGTRDQLLLATRIGLAQRLLPQPGFLVLDDAFLFSDVTREVILINALKKFQAKGWQIIYLTVSPHTKELFEEIWGIKAFLINQK